MASQSGAFEVEGQRPSMSSVPLSAVTDDEGVALTKTLDLRLLATAAFPGFFGFINFASVVPLMGLYARDYGFSVLAQGVVLSSLQVGWCAGLVIFNVLALSVRLPTRTIVAVGCILCAMSPVVLLVFPAAETVAFMQVCQGTGNAMVSTGMQGAIVRGFPSHLHGRAFAAQSVFISAGAAYGLVVGQLYDFGRLRALAAALLGIGCLGFSSYICVVPESWFRARDAAVKKDRGQECGRFSHILRGPQAGLLACAFLSAFLLSSYWTAIPTALAREFEMSAVAVSIFWSGLEAGKICCSVLGGITADCPEDCCGSVVARYHVLFGLQICVLGLLNAALFTDSALVFCVASASVIWLGGTTPTAGLMGPMFQKVMNRVEVVQGKGAIEEIYSLWGTAVALGGWLGPLVTGFVYRGSGFFAAVEALVAIAVPLFVVLCFLNWPLFAVRGTPQAGSNTTNKGTAIATRASTAAKK
eukprot:CAMPEP_0204310862 /NCGR_PEP_ID=MMETSP0469-20131031/1984_1 /ASSEMBLY_ACC=CAM_ASM_000384 /TAXON_ID=2969 /ORGANISM="Oxyrrhis marina" /LENGTH=471 /DNA_ID=CAMNT_0051290707 /DNA_START=24 /DNA_END=1436 /DNA_ORIENTATION=+